MLKFSVAWGSISSQFNGFQKVLLKFFSAYFNTNEAVSAECVINPYSAADTPPVVPSD